MKRIAHALGQHRRPLYGCRACSRQLLRQWREAQSVQTLIGRCHEPGDDHAWYHKHAFGSGWYRPAEDRGFA